MGRQYRSPRRGSSGTFAGPALVTSSSVNVVIPNYGMTDMTTWAAGEYVLDAPDVGVRKTLVKMTSAATVVVVRGSPSTANNVSIGTLAATTGSSGGYQITFNATVSQCVVLLGLNSTFWAVESMYPPTAANSTGIVIGAT